MAEILGNTNLNNIDIVEVDGDPVLGLGTDSAIGNIAIVNQAGFPLFQKFGNNPTDWRPIAVRSFAQYSNTQTNQNLNTSSPTQVGIFGSEINKDNDFILNGQSIQVSFTGFVKCYANLHLFSNNGRTNLNIRFRKNGNIFFGPIGASGYIRNATNHNESSISIYSIISVVQNEIIDLVSIKEAGNGSVFLDQNGTSEILFERY